MQDTLILYDFKRKMFNLTSEQVKCMKVQILGRLGGSVN